VLVLDQCVSLALLREREVHLFLGGLVFLHTRQSLVVAVMGRVVAGVWGRENWAENGIFGLVCSRGVHKCHREVFLSLFAGWVEVCWQDIFTSRLTVNGVLGGVIHDLLLASRVRLLLGLELVV